MNLSIGQSNPRLGLPNSYYSGGMDRAPLGAVGRSFQFQRNMLFQPQVGSKSVPYVLEEGKTTKEEKKTPDPAIEKDDEVEETQGEYSNVKLVDLLREHDLLVKYKRGDKIVSRFKTMLKKGAYNRFVKFKTDRKLQWSPQFYLDGDLTTLRGYMGKELLRLNIIDQLEEWAAAESDSEDSSENSSSESEEEEIKDEDVEEIKDEDVEEIKDEDVEEIKDEDVEEVNNDGEEENTE